MDRNKTDVVQAMEMTLDEYITVKGTYIPPVFKKNTNYNDDNEDADIIELKTDDTELLKTDDTELFDKQFDLRDRINESNLPKSNSLQWRLLPFNVNRPPGMPPLTHRENNNCQRPNFCRNNYNNNGRPNNRYRQQKFYNWNNRQNYNKKLQNESSLNFTVQVPSKSNDAVDLSANQRKILNLPKTQTVTSTTNDPKVNILQDLNALTMNNNVLNAVATGDSSESLRQLQFLSATLLNALPKKEPKYDMKVQKDINQIQKKDFFYKSGGEVISQDGRGINTYVKPSNTGITLNQRFA